MPSRLNKIRFYLEQIEDYWFHGPQQRFATHAGIAPSTFSRILLDKVTHPRYEIVCKIVTQLEKKLHRKLDPREVYQTL